ncbi:MAG: hypothetical protein P4L22_03630 [Candidatus Babeliales bacterium]|nr:hypothetical protein [Candidatus Babeliales bacterium]
MLKKIGLIAFIMMSLGFSYKSYSLENSMALSIAQSHSRVIVSALKADSPEVIKELATGIFNGFIFLLQSKATKDGLVALNAFKSLSENENSNGEDIMREFKKMISLAVKYFILWKLCINKLGNPKYTTSCKLAVPYSPCLNISNIPYLRFMGYLIVNQFLTGQADSLYNKIDDFCIKIFSRLGII